MRHAAQAPRQSFRQQSQHHQHRCRPAHEFRREAGRGRQQQHQRRDYQRGSAGRDPIDPRRPRVARRHGFAEQAGGRYRLRPAKRRHREHHRRQQAECRRQQQRRGIDAQLRRQGQAVSIEIGQRIGCDGPYARAQNHRRQRDRHHLQEEHQEHQFAVRAQRFQNGDIETLAVQEGGDRFTRADPAHAQRGQPYQGQEHSHLFDKAADAGRCIGAVADLPAGIGKSRRCVSLEALDCRAVRECDAIGVFLQASRLHQTGAG